MKTTPRSTRSRESMAGEGIGGWLASVCKALAWRVRGARRSSIPRSHHVAVPLVWLLTVQFLSCLLVSVSFVSDSFVSVSFAMDPVRIELGKEQAWTGEAVPLIVTLYSPGPFSGTAAFDWPELSLTTIVSGGSPVVGSEQIDDETYLTQRHEFIVYTQREGEMVIPPFSVRFTGKKDFISNPEPVVGLTRELRFQSRRPPGSREQRLVVVATKMEVSQDWHPQRSDAIVAGDVIARTITRRAVGTTAMMLSPLASDVPEGVRVHATEPVVEDHVERGAALAERTETIKYQFERAGAFRIPDLALSWWDPESQEWKRATLPGRDVEVQDTFISTPAMVASSDSRWPGLLVLLGVVGTAALAWGTARWLLAAFHARRSHPVAVAARQLLTACRTNSASATYAAFLKWRWAAVGSLETEQLIARLPRELAIEFEREWNQLARRVFGGDAVSAGWSGANFARLFVQLSREWSRDGASPSVGKPLPALNPSRQIG